MDFLEYFVYNIAPSLTAGTGTVFEDSNFLINKDDFIFRRTIHVATANTINVKLFNPETGRYLFKGSDDIRHVSGTSLNGLTAYGFVPYNWPIPYRVKGNTYMKAQFADAANNGANQLYMAFHGDKVMKVAPLDMHNEPVDYSKKRRVSPIIYECDTITTGAAVGAISQGVVRIDDDSDFVCTRITGVATGTGFIKIRDEMRGIEWQNQKTHIQTLLGNGQFPNNLTSPVFVKKNSSLLITWENLVGGANSLNLHLHGYKRF